MLQTMGARECLQALGMAAWECLQALGTRNKDEQTLEKMLETMGAWECLHALGTHNKDEPMLEKVLETGACRKKKHEQWLHGNVCRNLPQKMSTFVG